MSSPCSSGVRRAAIVAAAVGAALVTLVSVASALDVPPIVLPIPLPVPSTIPAGPALAGAPTVPVLPSTDTVPLTLPPVSPPTGTVPITVPDLGNVGAALGPTTTVAAARTTTSPAADSAGGPPSTTAPAAFAPGGGGRSSSRSPSSAPGASRPGSATIGPARGNTSNAERIVSDPGGVTGTLAGHEREGLWSLLAGKARGMSLWIVLLALALVVRLVAASAWRDAVRRRGNSATR